MKKFKIVVTKVPQGSKLKAEQRVEASASDMEELEKSGHEFVMASEFDATAKAKGAEAQLVKANEARINKAVERAVKRGAIKAKQEDLPTITASAVKMEGAEIGLGEQFIDALPTLPGEKDLSQRLSRPGEVQGSEDHVWRGKVTAAEAAEGYIKASTPSQGMVRQGKWNEAFAESKVSGIALKELVEAGGEDMILSRLVKGASTDSNEVGNMMHDGIVRADYTDPNTQVGILNTGLVIMRNLGFLKNKLNFMSYITTDLRNEAVRFGQAVDTRYIVVPGVLTWVPGIGFTSDATAISTASAGTNQSGVASPTATAVATTPTNYVLTKSAPSTPDVTVTMNQFKAVEIEFPISTLAGTVRNLFAEQRGAQTYALAEHIHSKFLATMFAATWTGTVNSLSLGNFALPGMIRIKNRMTLSKIPDVGRYALMHSTYHDALLTDTNLLTAKAILALINKDASSFESGEVPELFGIKPLESQLSSYKNGVTTAPIISGDGTTVDFTTPGVNQVGFAGNMSSMVFVARVPQDFNQTATSLGIPSTNAVEIVTDPDSNLSVMIFKYVDNGKMSVSVRMCLMYGFAQGDPRVGIVLTP